MQAKARRIRKRFSLLMCLERNSSVVSIGRLRISWNYKDGIKGQIHESNVFWKIRRILDLNLFLMVWLRPRSERLLVPAPLDSPRLSDSTLLSHNQNLQIA